LDFLGKVLASTERRIASGYYDIRFRPRGKKSLADAIRNAAARGKTPLIAEIKPFSPTAGRLVKEDPTALAARLVAGGACALSVLTEPEFFGGSAALLQAEYPVPVLQKDFVYSERQFLDGADAILLIQAVLDRKGVDVDGLIEKAHERGFEVLLEAHSLEEFRRALRTRADLIGINNRSLTTLKTDLRTAERVLGKAKADRIVVAESGIGSREDVRRMMRAGADAVLVGTSILRSGDLEKKVAELIG